MISSARELSNPNAIPGVISTGRPVVSAVMRLHPLSPSGPLRPRTLIRTLARTIIFRLKSSQVATQQLTTVKILHWSARKKNSHSHIKSIFAASPCPHGKSVTHTHLFVSFPPASGPAWNELLLENRAASPMLRRNPPMNYWRLLSFTMTCSVASAWSNVVINEIHYNPPVKTDLTEFIELYNTGADAVSLAGWQIQGGVQFTFPAGSSIAANGYLVVAENPGALKAHFGADAVGPWTGGLSNQGETVELRDASGASVNKVSYQEGFPWPTVGDAPGYSIELVNPAFDNKLGGNWRRSVRGSAGALSAVLIPQKSLWKFRKGTSEASSPIGAWRDAAFDDSGWSAGSAPIGYDPTVTMQTVLADMKSNYTSVYFRKVFQVSDPAEVSGLLIDALYDDGIQLWINGQRVASANMPDRDVAFNELSTGAAREADSYDPFPVSSPGTLLRAGDNIIAVQLQNVSLAGSSDAFLDLKLTAQLGSVNAGPTPGARNAVFDTNLPPVIRQVDHSPEQPKSGEAVTITAKITDTDGVSSVRLEYQVVDPGNNIELNDPAYQTNWTSVVMLDDGTNGDAQAGDAVYSAVLPGDLQTHRRLVRYRIVAADSVERAVKVPYEDDPQPNFAYFVYDGIPGWQGAIQPGSSDSVRSQVQTFSAAEMGRLPTYHLISKRSSVETATWTSKYTGSLYSWWGTLVYDGKVYDHIRYRARGGVWRYAMGKNMWKFDLNRGHDFEARDNYGRKYNTNWKKINLGAGIQQGDYLHRGEQGMFESVGFAFFNLVGVQAPNTHWMNYRIIDKAAEAPSTNQYGGDYWGVYLAVEQEDNRFLAEHDLPDGNLYKMEGGTGTLNNQGLTAATDKSDLNAFMSVYQGGSADENWWRQNFELDEYYSYQSIVQGIHHYDTCDGKNYFYFLNPLTGQWSIHTWDLDLTWADNMYRDCDGADPFHSLVVAGGKFNLEFKNRAREVRDLLYNTDQAYKLIDEFAGIVRGTNTGPNILAADRAMWDYNPVMANANIVNTSKAGQGKFYQFPNESARNPVRKGSFEAAVGLMKDYVMERSAFLDQRTADALIPARPTVNYGGPAGFPLNRLEFQTSSYSGANAFAAIKWRLAEVCDAVPGTPGIYEIQPVWESPEVSIFTNGVIVPAEYLKVAHNYRARVRMKDVTGRWSNWSAPVEFAAGEPDNATALEQSIRPTEIMYNPPAGSEWEFLELQNVSSNITADLGGATFTAGIDFTFPAGATLNPGEYGLVVKSAPTNNFAAFRQFYRITESVKIFGPYGGSLDNSGERVTLKTAAAGTVIFSVNYQDGTDWPADADGGGYSLVVREGVITQPNTPLDDPASWRASSAINGSPGVADSSPLELGVVIKAGVVALQFSASAAKTYRIEYRNDLSAGSWQTLREFSDTDGAVSVEDPEVNSGKRFYRLAVIEAP